MNEHGRAASEWARHWDVICLGTMTVATAVTGISVAIATDSEMFKALAAGNPTDPVIAWGGLGVTIMVLYLAIVLLAGVAIHLFPGHRPDSPGVKRAGIAIVHALFALEVIALASLLMLGILATPGEAPQIP